MSDPTTPREIIASLRQQITAMKKEWEEERREIAELRAHAERVGEANDRLVVENAELRKAKEMVELERCEMMRSMSLAQNQSEQLRKDKARLDFLSTLTGSGWACLHLNNKGANDDWFLTRKQIDRRMATEPKQ